LLFNWLNQSHPLARTAFRFSRLVYQLSKCTYSGRKPRCLAAASMCRK
jgi:hypothetical protein